MAELTPLQTQQVMRDPGRPTDPTLPPEALALLDVIASTESPGYNVLYGGSRFSDYSDHPRERVPIRSGPNAGNVSTAAGRYQFLGSTYDSLGMTDMSPWSQDRGAWQLAQRDYRAATGRDLLADLRSGDADRMRKIGTTLSGTWTSLPGGIEATTNTNRFARAYDRALSTQAGHPVPPSGMPTDPPIPADRTRVAELRQDFAARHMPTPAPLSQRQAAADRFEQRYRAPLPMPSPLSLPIERTNAVRSFGTANLGTMPTLMRDWTPGAREGAGLTPLSLSGARSVTSVPMTQNMAGAVPGYDPRVPSATMGLPARPTSAPGAGVTPQQRSAMAALPRAPAPLPAPGAGLSPAQRNAMAAVPRTPTPLPALSAPGAGLSPAQRAAMSAVPTQPKAVSPSFAQSFASAINAPKANPAVTRTVPLAGQTQMPRDVRPAVLSTPQMAMPMPTLSQRAPIPATMSPQMAASRFPSALAPIPATMSAGLAAQRFPSALAPMPASVAARDLARSRGVASQPSSGGRSAQAGVIQAGPYAYTKGPQGYVRVAQAGGSSSSRSSGGGASYFDIASSGGSEGGIEGNGGITGYW